MTRYLLVVTVVCLVMAAWLTAQNTAPPLRLLEGEPIYLREAKHGLCVKLMLGLQGASLTAYIVPDRECEP